RDVDPFTRARGTRNGARDGHGQVVLAGEGLRLHQAGGRPRRFRPPPGHRGERLQDALRGRAGGVRHRRGAEGPQGAERDAPRSAAAGPGWTGWPGRLRRKPGWRRRVWRRWRRPWGWLRRRWWWRPGRQSRRILIASRLLRPPLPARPPARRVAIPRHAR